MFLRGHLGEENSVKLHRPTATGYSAGRLVAGCFGFSLNSGSKDSAGNRSGRMFCSTPTESFDKSKIAERQNATERAAFPKAEWIMLFLARSERAIESKNGFRK